MNRECREGPMLELTKQAAIVGDQPALLTPRSSKQELRGGSHSPRLRPNIRTSPKKVELRLFPGKICGVTVDGRLSAGPVLANHWAADV